MWELIGNRQDNGVPARVRFDENGLTSSASDFLTVMQAYALQWGAVGVTPVGPWVIADLSDETAAFLVANELLRKNELSDGVVPPMPDLPAPAPNEAF